MPGQQCLCAAVLAEAQCANWVGGTPAWSRPWAAQLHVMAMAGAAALRHMANRRSSRTARTPHCGRRSMHGWLPTRCSSKLHFTACGSWRASREEARHWSMGSSRGSSGAVPPARPGRPSAAAPCGSSSRFAASMLAACCAVLAHSCVSCPADRRWLAPTPSHPGVQEAGSRERLPRPHGHRGRPQGAGSSAEEGPQGAGARLCAQAQDVSGRRRVTAGSRRCDMHGPGMRRLTANHRQFAGGCRGAGGGCVP